MGDDKECLVWKVNAEVLFQVEAKEPLVWKRKTAKSIRSGSNMAEIQTR
jgi:hypothetical protein